jgi:hypothetical protein
MKEIIKKYLLRFRKKKCKLIHRRLSPYYLLFVSDYKNLLSCSAVYYYIELRDSEPVKVKSYCHTLIEKKFIKEKVTLLLNQGLIEEKKTPYTAHIVLVKKKDEKQHMCIDYQKLNVKIVIKEFLIL